MGYGDTTNKLMELLKDRYSTDAYAFFPQVRNGTGFSREARTADAVVMGLWPSRGLDLHGFEVKAFRADWMKELKHPDKAEAIARFCDHWWIVAPDKSIVSPDEVPKNWGLMLQKGNRLVCVKEAPQLKAKQIDRLFLAALLRKAQECITPDAKLREARAEGMKRGKEIAESSMKYELDSADKLNKVVKDFERASGIRIETWQGGKALGDAVRIVLKGEDMEIKRRLLAMRSHAESILEDVTKHITEMEETMKGKKQ